jgi:hypothetical protein
LTRSLCRCLCAWGVLASPAVRARLTSTDRLVLASGTGGTRASIRTRETSVTSARSKGCAGTGRVGIAWTCLTRCLHRCLCACGVLPSPAVCARSTTRVDFVLTSGTGGTCASIRTRETSVARAGSEGCTGTGRVGIAWTRLTRSLRRCLCACGVLASPAVRARLTSTGRLVLTGGAGGARAGRTGESFTTTRLRCACNAPRGSKSRIYNRIIARELHCHVSCT